jgi:hypothetical protein
MDLALDTTAPLWHPVEVLAQWQELPPGYPDPDVNNFDSLKDLGQQIGPQGFVVKQSFDDGLPQGVTMTTANDASGSLAMDLVGRMANVADTWSFRTAGSGTGTGTSVTIPAPTGSLLGDYTIVGIAVSSLTNLADVNADIEDRHGWDLLDTEEDGTLKLWVWGRTHYTGAPSLSLSLAASASYSWVSQSFVAQTAGGSPVGFRVGVPVSKSETVTGTAKTLPAMNLDGRGWGIGIWATTAASAQFTAAGGGTEIIEAAATTDVMMSRSPTQVSIDDALVLSASTSGSTGVGAYVGIPLIFDDRESMDATAYFSPFKADSPIVDFERDTAPVTASVQAVFPGGITGQRVFTGRMADIELGDRTAQMTAKSQTRIDLDKALTLPTVYARRAGLTTDWLTTWIMARGGMYPGVAPGPNTRFWAPLHGSSDPHLDGPLGYSSALSFQKSLTPVGPYTKTYPDQVDGPFVTGINAERTEDYSSQINIQPDRYINEGPPGIMDAVGPYDFLSQANNEGRLSFWIRGDAAVATPGSLTGMSDKAWLFRFVMWNDPVFNNGYVRFQVNTDRSFTMYLNNSLALTGGDLPTDDAWHFIGVTWQYSSGLAYIRRDNVVWNTSGYSSTTDVLPATDAAWLAASSSNSMGHLYQSFLPIAELQLETGPGLYAAQFSRFYPTPALPSQNTLYRPTRQHLEVVSEVVPIQGWSLLQELQQATISSMRCNEEDLLEFVPLDYFGEDAQMTPETIALDTDVNAAELKVLMDATKTRNVVTVEFDDTRVDTLRTSLLDLTSALQIPAGVSDVTFALDLPTVEIHGASQPYSGSTWNITKLNNLQVAGTNPLPNEHFMSVSNSESAVVGAYTLSTFTARIIMWDSSTVTVRFTNNTRQNMWLSNNGSGIPFLRILGYPVRRVTGYSTVRDPGSVNRRRERALSTARPWIDTRAEAENLANRLISVLSLPRPEINVRVVGDPRRRPGQLVSLADTEGTAAAGTWRVLSVAHNGNGPEFTQDLQLVYVLPVAIWDQSNWDESVWGE